jgi:hypothetical protein
VIDARREVVDVDHDDELVILAGQGHAPLAIDPLVVPRVLDLVVNVTRLGLGQVAVDEQRETNRGLPLQSGNLGRLRRHHALQLVFHPRPFAEAGLLIDRHRQHHRRTEPDSRR